MKAAQNNYGRRRRGGAFIATKLFYKCLVCVCDFCLCTDQTKNHTAVTKQQGPIMTIMNMQNPGC